MVFSEFVYKRPTLIKTIKEADRAIKGILKAVNYEDFKSAFFKIQELIDKVSTQSEIAEIRYTIDTKNKFYRKEMEYLNWISPLFEMYLIKYYKAVLNSKFINNFEEEFGKHFCTLALLKIKSLKKRLVLHKILENIYSMKYQSLLASCSMELFGEKHNLSGLLKLMQSNDRNTRRKAYDAYASFFAINEKKFDSIFDILIKIRHGMAKLMGFKNYVALGYMNMSRTDYTPDDVAAFRQQILQECVPLSMQLLEEQKKNLKLDALYFYDESMHYVNGNEQPSGDIDYIVQEAVKMYKELSPETGEFISIMKDKELMDLVTKKNKAPGGYCTFLPEYDVPFIFSNFNGTSDDIVVLTHEAGHAFQSWLSNKLHEISEYRWSTSEVDEIHSMSMEFFTHPWMKSFFSESEKFIKKHYIDTIVFMPYSACVDEFQHIVYEDPWLTPSERKKVWRELEKKYLPTRNYDGKKIFDNGGFFFKQMHIFIIPFYYIDYTMASLGAIEFYGKAQVDFKSSWNDYIHLCRLGGSKPYFELLKEAKLGNPLKEGSIKKAVTLLLNKMKKA